MKKVLDILIPIYGKDPIETFKNIKDIASKIDERSSIIAVYKNSESLNYDNLKELETNYNVKTFCLSSSAQKTDKLIKALELSSSNYVLPLDAHHNIDKDNYRKAIDKISKINAKIISMNKFEVNIDTNEKIIGESGWLTSGSYILNTKNLKKIVSKIKYRTTFSDDLTFPLLVLSNLTDNESITRIEEIFYIKRRGIEISNTTFSKNIENDEKLIDSLEKILRFYFESLNSNRQFNSQFISAFWYLYNRKVLYNKKLGIPEDEICDYWNTVFLSGYTKSELINLLKISVVYPNRFDKNNFNLRKYISSEVKVTLAFPIYSLSIMEAKNLSFTINNIPKNSQVVVLIDNPKINIELIKVLPKNCKIIEAVVNKGKYQLIMDNALFFDGTHTKVCDPDDLILIKELSEFNLQILDEKNVPFVRFTPTLNVPSGEWDSEKINEDRNMIRERSFKSVVNENSLIPTVDLVGFDLIAYNQTKSSDVLLSLSHFHKDIINVVDYANSFYVYNFRKGLTSDKKNDNLAMFNQLITFLDIMIKFNEKNKMLAPSFFDYKWAHNFILRTNLTLNEKKDKMSIVFDKLSICAKDNDGWEVSWNEIDKENLFKMLDLGEYFIL